MRYRRLGRTGLEVSVLSLGTGGPNRLGQSRHVSKRRIHALFARALDLGINLFDTSSAYEHSESLLGNALHGTPRDRYYLCSKIYPWRGKELMKPDEIRQLVQRSLRRLQVDEIDLFQLHRVTPGQYDETRDRVLPELVKMRTEGKVRFIGISESSTRDPQHHMLQRALRDDLYDTCMLAYHPLNISAGQTVFPLAQQQDVGVICMAIARPFVARSIPARLHLLGGTLAGLFTSPPANFSRFRARIKDAVRDVTRSGAVQSQFAGQALKEAWLRELAPAGVSQLPEAAYAFALQPDAVATVLTGTTDIGHLDSNARAVLASLAASPASG
jgi:L-galactose dehydrogenase